MKKLFRVIVILAIIAAGLWAVLLNVFGNFVLEGARENIAQDELYKVVAELNAKVTVDKVKIDYLRGDIYYVFSCDLSDTDAIVQGLGSLAGITSGPMKYYRVNIPSLLISNMPNDTQEYTPDEWASLNGGK